MGALDATGATVRENSDQHHHFPHARRLRLGWRDVGGRWVAAQEDEHRWEVVCVECGDADGPAENQSASVQRLRGPYGSEHKAKHAATKHFDQN